jgi:hypothetical protein
MDLNPNTIQARSLHILQSFEKGNRLQHKYIRKEGDKYIYKEPEAHENKDEHESMHIAFSNMDEFFKDDKQATEAISFLKPLIKKNKNIRIDPNMEFENNRVLGLSYPDGRIGINKNSVYANNKEMVYRTLLHEMVHAVTRKEIESNSILRDDFRDTLGIIRKKLEIPDDDTVISVLYAQGYISEEKYGASNEHELIAEVFTNKKFYDLLKSIEYKGDSLLKKVFISIAAAFSKKGKKVKEAKKNVKVNNMADYLMNLTESVLKPVRKINKKIEKAFESIMNYV